MAFASEARFFCLLFLLFYAAATTEGKNTTQATTTTTPPVSDGTIKIPLWILYAIILPIIGIAAIVGLTAFCCWICNKRQATVSPTILPGNNRIVNDLTNQNEEKPVPFDHFVVSQESTKISKKPKKAVNCLVKKETHQKEVQELIPGIERLKKAIDSVKEERDLRENEDQDDAVSENTLNHLKEETEQEEPTDRDQHLHRRHATTHRSESLINTFKIETQHAENTHVQNKSQKLKLRRHRKPKESAIKRNMKLIKSKLNRTVTDESDDTSEELTEASTSATLTSSREESDLDPSFDQNGNEDAITDDEDSGDDYAASRRPKRKKLGIASKLRGKNKVIPVSRKHVPLPDMIKQKGSKTFKLKDAEGTCVQELLPKDLFTKQGNIPQNQDSGNKTPDIMFRSEFSDIEKKTKEPADGKQYEKVTKQTFVHVPREGPVATSSFKSKAEDKTYTVSDDKKKQSDVTNGTDYGQSVETVNFLKEKGTVKQPDGVVSKQTYENYKQFEEMVTKRGKVNLNRSVSLNETDRYKDEMNSRRRKRKYQSLRQAKKESVFDAVQTLDKTPKKSILKKSKSLLVKSHNVDSTNVISKAKVDRETNYISGEQNNKSENYTKHVDTCTLENNIVYPSPCDNNNTNSLAKGKTHALFEAQEQEIKDESVVIKRSQSLKPYVPQQDLNKHMVNETDSENEVVKEQTNTSKITQRNYIFGGKISTVAEKSDVQFKNSRGRPTDEDENISEIVSSNLVRSAENILTPSHGKTSNNLLSDSGSESNIILNSNNVTYVKAENGTLRTGITILPHNELNKESNRMIKTTNVKQKTKSSEKQNTNTSYKMVGVDEHEREKREPVHASERGLLFSKDHEIKTVSSSPHTHMADNNVTQRHHSNTSTKTPVNKYQHSEEFTDISTTTAAFSYSEKKAPNFNEVQKSTNGSKETLNYQNTTDRERVPDDFERQITNPFRSERTEYPLKNSEISSVDKHLSQEVENAVASVEESKYSLAIARGRSKTPHPTSIGLQAPAFQHSNSGLQKETERPKSNPSFDFIGIGASPNEMKSSDDISIQNRNHTNQTSTQRVGNSTKSTHMQQNFFKDDSTHKEDMNSKNHSKQPTFSTSMLLEPIKLEDTQREWSENTDIQKKSLFNEMATKEGHTQSELPVAQAVRSKRFDFVKTNVENDSKDRSKTNERAKDTSHRYEQTERKGTPLECLSTLRNPSLKLDKQVGQQTYKKYDQTVRKDATLRNSRPERNHEKNEVSFRNDKFNRRSKTPSAEMESSQRYHVEQNRSKTPTPVPTYTRNKKEVSFMDSLVDELKPKHQTSSLSRFQADSTKLSHIGSFSKNFVSGLSERSQHESFRLQRSKSRSSVREGRPNTASVGNIERTNSKTSFLLNRREKEINTISGTIKSRKPSERERPKSAMSMRSNPQPAAIETVLTIPGNTEDKSENMQIPESSTYFNFLKNAPYQHVGMNKPNQAVKIPNIKNNNYDPVDTDDEIEMFFANSDVEVLQLENEKSTTTGFVEDCEKVYSAYRNRNALSKSKSFKF